MFRNAIVRIPGENLDQGLTSSGLGKPLHARSLEQHAAYCSALEKHGLRVWALPPDLAHPDSTFVEDTAVLTKSSAILTHPGAKSREGEVARMEEVLGRFFRVIKRIQGPGTLDGGDVCEAGNHFFIGISHRTNADGARQLAGFLSEEDFTTSFVDIRSTEGILHLKSGLAHLGKNVLAVIESLACREPFAGYELIRVPSNENYAANCLRLNDAVLIPSGFPLLESSLRQGGYDVHPLEMSEFQKMDGGLSCLSLRF
ncbi:MAG: hypothetical protein WCD27_05980 [Candidatus Acidiferrales bacterium]